MRRNKRHVMTGEPSSDFSALHSKLKELECSCNVHGEDLHFFRVEHANSKLFSSLLALAASGLRSVRAHRAYFMEVGLYEDGMFWYDLCLLVSSASLSARHDQVQKTIPHTVSDALLLALVDISEFSVRTGGDMAKRNHEAIGNMLLCFHDGNTVDLVTARAIASGVPEVMDFVQGTIARVEVVRSAKAGSS